MSDQHFPDPEQDRRVEFATLESGELRRLIAAAYLSDEKVKYLDGKARAALYATAIVTAYRPQELSRLNVSDFILDGTVP